MRYITIVLFLLCFGFLSAQKEYDNWYFGSNAGISFTSGTATALINGAITAIDNPAAVSDSAGNLLFYCSGTVITDRTHANMLNGTGLLANSSGGHAATIVRKPGSYNLYYVFTMDAFAGGNGLRYSMVDMNLNGGLGAVVANEKNVLIGTPMSEQVIAIPHRNGNDIWLVTHTWNSSVFETFLISSSGISNATVSSNIGVFKGDPAMNNVWGQITVNAENDKIAWTDYNSSSWQLFDFDNSTGRLSNALTFTGFTNAWGIEFSEDGKKIYVDGWTTKYVYQFDLTNYTQSAITASGVNLGSVSGPGNPYYTGYMQRGPDGKIYIAVYDDTYLAVINSPNLAGAACGLVDNGFYLGGKHSEAGLPDKVVVTRLCSREIAYLNVPEDTICQNSGTIALKGGLPVEGYYYGNGVSGNIFDPISVLPGETTVYYSIKSDSACYDTASYSIFVEVCTDIKNLSSSDISIYPNPANDKVTLNVNGVYGEMEVVIYDIARRIIKRYIEKIPTSANYAFTINTCDIASGSYILGANINGTQKNYEFIVAKR